jgi:hypothetical protein
MLLFSGIKKLTASFTPNIFHSFATCKPVLISCKHRIRRRQVAVVGAHHVSSAIEQICLFSGQAGEG